MKRLLLDRESLEAGTFSVGKDEKEDHKVATNASEDDIRQFAANLLELIRPENIRLRDLLNFADSTFSSYQAERFKVICGEVVASYIKKEEERERS